MLSALSPRQIKDWEAYDRLEPIGMKRLEYNFAMLAAIMRNCWRGKDSDPVSIEDCLLQWDKDPDAVTQKKMSVEAMKAALMLLVKKKPSDTVKKKKK